MPYYQDISIYQMNQFSPLFLGCLKCFPFGYLFSFNLCSHCLLWTIDVLHQEGLYIRYSVEGLGCLGLPGKFLLVTFLCDLLLSSIKLFSLVLSRACTISLSQCVALKLFGSVVFLRLFPCFLPFIESPVFDILSLSLAFFVLW